MKDKHENIRAFYEEAFRSLDRQKNISQINVEFYKYVGINHTIRLRENTVKVRISEIFRDAPAEVQKALAFILTAKLCRKRIPEEQEKIYRNYSKSVEIQNRARENRQKQGRKIISGAKGTAFDLERIFTFLNQIYFDGNLPRPTLTWSLKNSFRLLGHHDASHDVIVISRILDNPAVPHFVVEYVMYHEMLHVKHPVQLCNGRRLIHSPAFRQDEKNFAYFTEAENWIEKHLAKLSTKKLKKGKKNIFSKLFNF